LDTLLDAYEQIGENIPPLIQYSALFVNNSNMRKVLELYYSDILEFHRRALAFFKRPGKLPTRILCKYHLISISLETALSFFLENFPDPIRVYSE
jgi:hypothetical protein